MPARFRCCLVVCALMAFSSTSALHAQTNCCTAHGTPGCDDPVCEEAVCAIAPFCCEMDWDAICVAQAGEQCPECDPCTISNHDCVTVGSAGCNDSECCELVCSFNQLCCFLHWDNFCVEDAQAVCYGMGTCPDSDHDCYTTGGVGCTDVACCVLVCANDDFCCEVAWDVACTNQAIFLCGPPSCAGVCPPGADDEGEPCGEAVNDDCVNALAVVCDVPICGTLWADNYEHDTDWFKLTIDTTLEVTFSIQGELPIEIGLAANVPPCVQYPALGPKTNVPICGSGSITVCLGPGTHYFLARANSFLFYPCGTSNFYVAEFTCAATGCVAPGCGAEGTGDCFTPNGTPYCDDAACCQTVCNFDAFCCAQQWDGACAEYASFFCIRCELPCPPGAIMENEPCGGSETNGCNGPSSSPSSCCSVHEAPGCDDENCTALVCGLDLFCCEQGWDAICVELAVLQCPDICPLDTYQPIACGQTVCGTMFAVDYQRDQDWFEFVLAEPTEITISAVAEFPLSFGLIATNGIPDCNLANELVYEIDTEVCETGTYTACLDAGTYWVFATPFFGDGIPCGDDGCGSCPDLDGNGTVDGADLGQLLGAWGPAMPGTCADFDGNGTVDGADLGELLAAWGNTCPETAYVQNHYLFTLDCNGPCTAPDCGVAGTGDCFSAGQTPYCDDEFCCIELCGLDAFCCEVVWDALCANEASAICKGSISTCCIFHSFPGCDDTVCNDAVCAIDAFCCEAIWDNVCVSEAGQLCPDLCDICPPSDHDCFTAGAPGCTDIACCEAVCSADAFCCQTAWDAVCVSEAEGLCTP